MAIDTRSSYVLGHSNLLCVLGMHRSGTSAVTQFLHRLGAAVVPQLIEAIDGVNQEGFWEDECIVDLNERLLSTRGCRWYSCCEVSTTRDVLAEAKIRNEAISHFRKNYSTKNLSVVKDPRLCRLLPFWLDVWAAVDANPIFVHVVRHPFAVAKSLHRRDKIPYELGVALWLLHTVEAMSSVSGHSGVVVVYDEFLQQPLELVDALISKYRVELPEAEASRSEAVNKTIKKELRHNGSSIDFPLGLRELQKFAVNLYKAIGMSGYGGPERAQLERWRNQLKELMSRNGDEMAMLDRLCSELMSLSADNVRVGELHSGALAVIRARDAELADRDQFISDLLHIRLWRLAPRFMRRVRKA